MRYYDVEGHDQPLLLSPEHAEVIGATEHEPTSVPTSRATKAEWVEYATGLGGDPMVLDTMTRAEIVEQYGG